MNEPERKILYLALALFALGLLYRYLPWEAPAISQRDSYSELEYSGGRPTDSKKLAPAYPDITDKVTNVERNSKKRKKSKNAEKRPNKPIFPIHVNRAGVEEMCSLKGVGPKLAEKIIDFRTKNGPFSGPGDLEKVPGIGKKKLEGLLQGVIFD
jgi:competence protein ComEA